MYFPKKNTSQTEPLINKDENGQSYDYDPTFKGMKKESRPCNDIFFGLLFILMLVAMSVVSIVAFTQGKPSLLLPSSQYAEVGEKQGQYWFQDAVAHMKAGKF